MSCSFGLPDIEVVPDPQAPVALGPAPSVTNVGALVSYEDRSGPSRLQRVEGELPFCPAVVQRPDTAGFDEGGVTCESAAAEADTNRR
jgi:hypothetical protein